MHANSIYSYLFGGIFFSTILYALFIWLFNLLCTFAPLTPINLENFYSFVFNNNQVSSTGSISKLILFSIVLNFLSIPIGLGIQKLFFKYKLDVKYPFLRVKSDWYYLLTGRRYILDWKNLFPTGFYVEIDLLCEIGKTAFIYKGSYKDYRLKDGELEYILLTDVRRFSMEELFTNTPNVNSNSTFINPISINSSIKSDDMIDAGGSISADGSIEAGGSITAGGPIIAHGAILGHGPIKASGQIVAKQGVTSVSSTNVANNIQYQIPGTVLAFKISDIKNINISYISTP